MTMSRHIYSKRNLFFRPYHQQGIAMVELLIALALLSMVIGIGYVFYWNGTTAFSKGGRQADMHFNLSQTSQFITNELRYASDVKIHAGIPDSLDASRRYIYVQNGSVKHVAGANTTVLNENISSRTYTLSFSKYVDASNANNNRSVDFTVTATDSGQNYSIQSQVHPLNLGTNVINGEATGPVISYKTSANHITFFAFIKNSTQNTQLSKSVFGYIKHPTDSTDGEITIGVPPGTSTLTDLVATFVTTGNNVKIAEVTQTSAETENSFENSETIPIRYCCITADGTTAYYNVRVKRLSSGKPRAKWVGIYRDITAIDPSTWTSDPGEPNDYFVEPGEVLKLAYVYDDNGTEETQGLTRYELLQNSASDPNNFQPISYNLASPGAGVRRNNIIRFKVPNDGTNYEGKAYRIRVTAVSIYGNEAELVSEEQITEATSRNTIMDTDSNDSFSDYMHDLVNEDSVLLRYESTNKVSFDVEGVAFTINATSANANGGSNLLKPFSSYIPDGDASTYKIIVDAQLTAPSTGSPGGYGILLGGTVDPVADDYHDNGYMIQFDPGANGFLIRKIVNGDHDPTLQYGVDKTYTPTDFCYGNTAFKNATYTSGSFNWYNRYKTEITVQKQAHSANDMTVRVRIYFTDSDGNTTHSNDMWFGDFGTYKCGSKTFTGSALSGTSTLIGDYLGVRTWINGTYEDSVVNKFYNIIIKSGYRLFVESEFIGQDEIALTRFYQIEDGISGISLNEDRNVLPDPFNSANININVGTSPDQEPDAFIAGTSAPGSSPAAISTATLVLGTPPSVEELQGTADLSSALDIVKNAFRQQYAGFVRIYSLGANIDPMGKDATAPTLKPSTLSSDRKTITVTFSEPMAYDALNNTALTTRTNYTLSRTLPLGFGTLQVEIVANSKTGFNPKQVILSSSNGISFRSSTSVSSVTDVTDVAGNSI